MRASCWVLKPASKVKASHSFTVNWRDPVSLALSKLNSGAPPAKVDGIRTLAGWRATR
jgi:hypothetical protein